MNTQTLKTWTLLLPNGNAINQKTILKKQGVRVIIETPEQLCKLIKAQWCKEVQCKSFTQWAQELNEDENFEGTDFTKEMALDNLASIFTLNIEKKHVNLYDYFTTHLPFKN